MDMTKGRSEHKEDKAWGTQKTVLGILLVACIFYEKYCIQCEFSLHYKFIKIVQYK